MIASSSTQSAAPAERPNREAAYPVATQIGGGNDRQDRVSDDHVVGAHERERHRSADRDDRQAARHEGATPQLARRTSQKQDEPDSEQRGREDAARDLRREAVADGETLRNAGDSRGERGVRHRLSRSTLVEEERQLGETDSRGKHDREGRQSARPGPDEEPNRLGQDEEEREVVRRERERGRKRPAHEVPPVASTEDTPEEEHRARREERKQAVRARLLRVPDEERVDADESGCDDADAARDESAPAPYATGTIAAPTSAERERSPTSPKPARRAQGHART